MRKINHFGVPTMVSQPGEVYNEGMKVWLTDFNLSSNKIEYLRFEEGSWMPEVIQKMPHIAYEVDSLAKEMEGSKILIDVISLSDELSIAFIEEEGIALELMEFTKK